MQSLTILTWTDSRHFFYDDRAQHGSIIDNKEIMQYVFELLATLKGVGIDGIIEDDYDFNSDKLRKRFE